MSPRTPSKKKAPATMRTHTRTSPRLSPTTRLGTEQEVQLGSAVLEGPIIRLSRREAKELAGELADTLEVHPVQDHRGQAGEGGQVSGQEEGPWPGEEEGSRYWEKEIFSPTPYPPCCPCCQEGSKVLTTSPFITPLHHLPLHPPLLSNWCFSTPPPWFNTPERQEDWPAPPSLSEPAWPPPHPRLRTKKPSP
jgi:hypothetical protein